MTFAATSSEKTRLIFSPTLISQSEARCKMQVLGSCSCLRSPVSFPFEIDRLQWWCLVVVGFVPLQVVHLAISVGTLSCLNQYWPSSSALNHILTRCPRKQKGCSTLPAGWVFFISISYHIIDNLLMFPVCFVFLHQDKIIAKQDVKSFSEKYSQKHSF